MRRKKEALKLKNWFLANQRDLPWRKNRDPYQIWLSEVMLQQTTTQAVVPYFEKFLHRFPDVHTLAESRIENVLEHWAGLGYYSRARNLHAAAQIISKSNFPKTASKLQTLPGFGPYTSRAVASIAFKEAVGVLDGNVIRVLCRYLNLNINWWETSEKEKLQKLADDFAQSGQDPGLINPALMELGATICTPKKPLCMLCPINHECKSRKAETYGKIPKPRPRRKSEIWLWTPEVSFKNEKVGLKVNDYLPFLKNSWIFPGTAKKIPHKPKQFDLKHSITHHEIYIVVKSTRISASKKDLRWIQTSNLKQVNPSSVLQKILASV